MGGALKAAGRSPEGSREGPLSTKSYVPRSGLQKRSKREVFVWQEQSEESAVTVIIITEIMAVTGME